MTDSIENETPVFQSGWALFLDVDGTLLDFVDTPDEIEAGPELIALLGELHRLSSGALVVVSGRSIESVDAIFAPLRLPVAGLHGLERRDRLGRTHRPGVNAAILSLARRRFSELVDRYPGTLIEEKGPAIAFHYRRAPTAAAAVEQLRIELESELPEPFCVQRGKMVVEVRSCSETKGSAIEAFMDEPGFQDRTAVFVGDDTTDEHGFRWVNDHGGRTIKVGGGESAARYRLDSVGDVVAWLADYAHFLRADREGAHES